MPWRPWKQPTAPDLDTQFEDLLHQVFDSERRANLMDRVDNAVRVEEERERARRRKDDPSRGFGPSGP